MNKPKYLKVKNGTFVFKVEIIFEERNMLKITVLSNKKIIAKVPQGKSDQEILKNLRNKSNWIYKQLNYFDKFQPLPEKRLFISGETHYYLGKQYRLKIVQGKNLEVKLKGKFFFIIVNNKNNLIDIQKKMENWYRLHAINIIQNKTQFYLEKFEIFKNMAPVISIKKMKKRWGSFSGKNSITLNSELIKTPGYCIDYVIVHELCHLIFPLHNNDFFNLLKSIMPDWEKIKARLERSII